MSVRRSLSLLVCSLALVVAGCGEDEPTPKVAAPSETPSVTPTATPTEAAAEETPEEFIQRWAELERDMLNTGETEDYVAVTGPCEACGGLVKQVTTFYEAGGYIEWPGMDVTRIKRSGPMSFDVWVDSKPTKYKRSESAKIESFPGGESKYGLTLKSMQGRLVLVEFVERPL